MTTLTPFTLAPDATRGRFAFLIHPRTDVAEDMGTVFPLLAKIPSRTWEWIFDRFPIKPTVQSKIFAQDSKQLLGECIIVPLTPRQLLGRDRKLVNRRIEEAVDYARKRGATLVGLGALTATVTSGGRKLADLTDIGVTNGNAFTAAATVAATAKIIAGLGFAPRVALVGATGSVGSAVAQVLGEKGLAGELILIGRNRKKLADLQGAIDATPVTVTTDITACREADLIILMTSATECLIESVHLKPNAIVLDDTQPRNTSETLLAERPDVQVIDGGLILTSGLHRHEHGGGLPLPSDVSFACLAETALLALIGHIGHGVIGDPTIEQVRAIQAIAEQHSYLGFDLAAPTSFGKPISVKGWNA